MGGGGSQSGDEVRTTRYAPYIEDKHLAFLDTTVQTRNSIINSSPYLGYEEQYPYDAMIGIGKAIADFPSLYDMFGKHMAGLDVEVVWTETADVHLHVTAIDTSVKADMVILDHKLVQDELPLVKIAMRDLNAVNSSSFVVVTANSEIERTKELSKLSSEAKFSYLDNISSRYNAHLNWQKGVVDTHANLMKLYYETADMAQDANYTFAGRNSLWPFEVLDFERAALATMQSAYGYRKSGLMRKRSKLSQGLSVLSWTVNGAVIGSEIMPGWGTAIGAVVGFIIGCAMMFLEGTWKF